MYNIQERAGCEMACVVVRKASLADLKWCERVDSHVEPAVLARKIETGEVFCALSGNQRVGYLRLEYLWSKIPYIGLILVEEQMRGRGIGRAMLEHISSALRQQGHTALYSSSQVDEPAPQAWHRSVGFCECGILNGINQGGIGEVFFRKDIV